MFFPIAVSPDSADVRSADFEFLILRIWADTDNNYMPEESTSDDDSLAQLRVTHKDEGDYMARGIKLTLDDDDLNLLKSGTSTLVELEPGHHRLRIDNTFHAKTVDFEVRAGEQVHYRIWNKRGFGSWLVELVGAGPMYLAIEKAEPLESDSVPLKSPTTS